MLQKATTNIFSNGMLLDQNPMTMPNTALSGALNATLVTRDGNELILQLDKGNGRVETAYLPEGFVPIGTVEFGGIIYIASYNPLTNRSEIGCFPSPERNITSDELSECGNTIDNSSFIESEKEYINSCLPTSYEDIPDDDKKEMASIKNKSIKLKVLTGTDGDIYKLNPGDRYKIFVSNKVRIDADTEISALAVNAGTISDIYSDDDNVVDETPRYLTIRMISLPEDGKIVYLDKNLKWDWDGNKYGYYISGDYKTNEGGTSIDLDSYRSLVSSAYNVFNSKISGELGLLFDLKVVNSITITWDADIYEEEDAALIPKPLDELPDDPEYRWARIRFYVNYESDSPRINLYRMIVTGSYLSVNGDRDENNNGCPFGLALKFDKDTFDPAVDDRGNGKPDRKNDGTDEDLKCDTDLFKYDISKLVDTIWNYELTPAMWFGNIDWLAIKGSINFKLLGSGVIDLIEWRYYVSATSLTLSWALEAYPEKNKKIFSVKMQFYDSDAIAEYYEKYTGNALDEISDTDHLDIDDKKSYSGYFQNIFVFDDTDLERDKLYLVKLIVKYGAADDEEKATDRIYLRWLYTTGQWNDEYLNAKGVLDFKELTLADVISFNASYDVTDNILDNTVTELTNVSIPSLNDISGSNEYTMLGAVVTTVNYHYNPIKPYFESDGKDFEVDMSINSENSLFSTTTNEFKFELDNGNIINTSSVLYDTNESPYGEYVKPLIAKIVKDNGELVGMPDPEGAAKTVLNICTTHIENADYYESAIDSFNALIQYDSSNKKHFGVTVLGMIYSKIDAEVSEETCIVGSVLRPMLYRRSDLADLNLHLDDDIEEGIIVKLKDDGSNGVATDSPLVFNAFFLILGENPAGKDNIIRTLKVLYDYEDNMPTTFSEVTMHKKDDWTLEKWSDGTDYSTKIVLPFNDLGGPLLAVLYIGYETGRKNSSISYYASGNRISRTRNEYTRLSKWLLTYIRMISFGLWLNNSTSSQWIPLNFFIHYDIVNWSYRWWYERDHDEIKYNDIVRKQVFKLNCVPAGIIASIYNSIYKIDSNSYDQEILETRTKNISWLGSLCEEIWQINVKCIATLCDDNISIGNSSLTNLQNNYYIIEDSYEIDSLSNNAADIANIRFSEKCQENEIGTCQLSHRFTINKNDYNDLFLKYKDLESTNIPYAAYYENDTTLHIIDNINADYYVYVDGELKPLDDDTALYICLTKELTINKVDDNPSNDAILCDLNSGRYHLLGDCDGAKLFADLGYDDGKPCFGKRVANMDLATIYFRSKDGNSNVGEINDCSGVKFGVNYINTDGTFDMTLGGGDINVD